MPRRWHAQNTFMAPALGREALRQAPEISVVARNETPTAAGRDVKLRFVWQMIVSSVMTAHNVEPEVAGNSSDRGRQIRIQIETHRLRVLYPGMLGPELLEVGCLFRVNSSVNLGGVGLIVGERHP